MKHLWKKIMVACLVISLLLTGIPSMATEMGEPDTTPTQTASVDWDSLFNAGQGEFVLPQEGTYAPNRLLVTRIDSGTSATLFSQDSITGVSTLFTVPLPQEMQEAALMDVDEEATVTCDMVALMENSDMLAVMEALSQEPGVLAVEFDRLRTISSEPTTPFAPANDPLEAQQTWLNLMGATKAWDMVTALGKVPGEGVTVAVLDTGIDSSHPDLKSQIASGGVSISFDTESDKTQYSENYEDGNGHGTHVSGIIAGAKNGTGIAGVAYGAKILPIKVLDDNGFGYDSAIVGGMAYAAGLIDAKGEKENNPKPRCQIANMSLGGSSSTPTLAYEMAATALRDMGVLLVVAAGNENTATSYVNPGNNYCPYIAPAYTPDAFSVMAMQETPETNGDYLASFSNWDSDPYAGAEYTLMAPGSNILSTHPKNVSSYASMNGTSMASPTVAGAAALVLSANPSYTAEDLWTVMATSGKELQGKTDAGGDKYYYHTMDVVAALNTNPKTVKSVVKGQAKAHWQEIPAINTSGDVLVLPMDGGKPQVKLTLRGYDADAYKVTATSPDLSSRDKVHHLAPGSTAEMMFTLNEMPTNGTFKTEIAITWTNNDGSQGSDKISLELPVFAALSGEKLGEIELTQGYYEQEIKIIWVFEKEIQIDLSAMTDVTEYTPLPALYYFGKDGSLINNSNIPLYLIGAQMIDPQIFGKVNLVGTTVSSRDVRSSSGIDITGGMLSCTIDGYKNLNLSVGGDITASTIAGCENTTVKASTIESNSFVNNFTFGKTAEDVKGIQITATAPAHKGDGSEADSSTGFYGNAVVGPATVHNADDGIARALDCYYLPTAGVGDNQVDIWVPEDINKLNCADGSTVYTEGVSQGSRPAMLEDCPTFLISTQRVSEEEPEVENQRLAYDLKSEFSRDPRDYEEQVPTYSALRPPYGNLPVVNLKWANDGSSCTYTVYTNESNRDVDDFYVLQGLNIPQQFDFSHPICARQAAFAAVTMEIQKVERGFEVSWKYADDSTPPPVVTEGGLTWVKLNAEESTSVEFTEEDLKAGTKLVEISDVQEGDAYSFLIVLIDEEGRTGIGSTISNIPYATPGDAISLLDSKGESASEINLSGTETVTLTLRADRAFHLKDGLKATVAFNGQALSLQSVVPPEGLFSGTAQQGNTAVVEIAPATEGVYIFEGGTIATLTFQGKNVTHTEGTLLMALTDFFGTNLLNVDEDGDGSREGIAFALTTKTTAVSSGGGGGGGYTPPKKNTQTLPDGTLVTTTTNPDGSIQIVYVNPNGVRSTVKNPVKGASTTASIDLPKSLEGKSVNVPIPMANGGITTVALLVGADGKEQIIPGCFWQNGVLTVPLKSNANIIMRDNTKTFDDLNVNDWFADGVAFVTSRELFRGVGEGKFAPQLPTSRAMLFVVLQRLAGESTAPKDGATWYDDAMAWAKKTGISDGTQPVKNITRQELAAMLYRYGGSPAVTQSTDSFPDSDQIAIWSQDAMAWAVEVGILKGDANGKLNPTAQATRAEVATMLARFVPVI